MAAYPYYNPYFPTTYQPAIPQPPTVPPYQPPFSAQGQPQQTAQAQVMASGITWVTEAQAADYVPSAGGPVALWLKDKPEIHLKSLDQMGKPTTVILDYQERTQAAPVVPQKPPEYATKADLDAVRADLDAVKSALKPARKGLDEDE